MRLLAIWFVALAGAAALSCAPPAPDPSLGVVRVALADSRDGAWGWTPPQRQAIAEEIVALAALGPEWRVVDPSDADVIIFAARLDAAGCGHIEANPASGGVLIEVDTQCAQGLTGIQRAAGHELAHYLTFTRWRSLLHLCDWAINDPPPPGCHPTIRCPNGLCLLAPGLRGVVDRGMFVEDYADDFADPAVREPDTDLVRACARAGRCD